MKPGDVGLSKDLQFFKPGNIIKENQRVTYTTVYKCDNFSVQLCIFFLPERGVIPLHNHPGMTVFSKLLLGQMHIKSYDWLHPDSSHNLLQQPSKLRLAKLKANDVFTAPCDTSVLYPTTGGNIHELVARGNFSLLQIKLAFIWGRSCVGDAFLHQRPHAFGSISTLSERFSDDQMV